METGFSRIVTPPCGRQVQGCDQQPFHPPMPLDPDRLVLAGPFDGQVVLHRTIAEFGTVRVDPTGLPADLHRVRFIFSSNAGPDIPHPEMLCSAEATTVKAVVFIGPDQMTGWGPIMQFHYPWPSRYALFCWPMVILGLCWSLKAECRELWCVGSLSLCYCITSVMLCQRDYSEVRGHWIPEQFAVYQPVAKVDCTHSGAPENAVSGNFHHGLLCARLGQLSL
jgi:hypothetical protein